SARSPAAVGRPAADLSKPTRWLRTPLPRLRCFARPLFSSGSSPRNSSLLSNRLPNAPDSDSIPNDKDDFVKLLLNNYMTRLGYDPIGLESNGKIDAKLLSGDYFVGHDFGWTDFNIDGATGKLLVTTWGSPAYTAEELAAIRWTSSPVTLRSSASSR